MKKLLSVVLALLMLAVMLPVVSLAADRVALNTITEAEDGTYDALWTKWIDASGEGEEAAAAEDTETAE